MLPTNSPRPAAERWAVPMVAGSCVLISVNGLVIRSFESANDWQIIFYRQAFFIVGLLLVLILQYRSRLPGMFLHVGWAGIGAGISLGLANPTFIIALSHTTVASALFTISASPLITAVLARIFLKEHISRPTMVAIVVAMIGITIMVSDGLLSGSVFGNLLALLCAFFFSMFVVFLRVGKDRNMLPSSVMGAIMGGMIGMVGSNFDFRIPLHDASLCFLWGAIIVTTVHYFFTLASRYITGAEIMLITLIEFTLGPIWVWLVFQEQPTNIALVGGFIVLSSVAARAVIIIHQERSARHINSNGTP